MRHSEISGDIPNIIENEEGLYEGNLIIYFRALFFQARNLNNPYHNFRHMLHVLWLCHKACRYYRDRLTPRQMRILLIAALFHDFDHTGCPHPEEEDPDGINIAIAISGLRRHILTNEREILPAIEVLVEATHSPYKISGDKLDLLGQIIRDADLAQALSPVWIQQVVIGLAQEWRVKPLQVLSAQKTFVASLAFNTEWAREVFPQKLVDAKLEEAEALLRLLEASPGDPAEPTRGAVRRSRSAAGPPHKIRAKLFCWQQKRPRAIGPPRRYWQAASRRLCRTLLKG
jgi:3'5'-cyclic nucleotide phosphodiesterase